MRHRLELGARRRLWRRRDRRGWLRSRNCGDGRRSGIDLEKSCLVEMLAEIRDWKLGLEVGNDY